jgi:hypothetical protein
VRQIALLLVIALAAACTPKQPAEAPTAAPGPPGGVTGGGAATASEIQMHGDGTVTIAGDPKHYKDLQSALAAEADRAQAAAAKPGAAK